MSMVFNFSNVLFSKVQQQILKILYLNIGKDFHTNEIIRLAKSGTGAVQRELEKLNTAGLITVKQMGNQKRYQANQSLPFFLELRSIVIKTFGLVDILMSALMPLLQKKIDIAFVYGSIAKQMDTANSDIDLLLMGDDITYAEIFELLKEAEVTLGKKINPTFYSTKEWTRKYREQNHFVRKIMDQPKIFLKGTEEQIDKLR